MDDKPRDWVLPGPRKLRYTRAEIARWLGIEPKTLDRAIADGLFPAGVKDTPGGEPAWSGADLAAYLQLRGRWQPATDNHGQSRTTKDNRGQSGTTEDK